MLQSKTSLNLIEETRFGINYRRMLEPFDIQVYTSNINELLNRNEAPDEFTLPAIEDFSQINLTKIEPYDLNRFIQWRMAQPKTWRADLVVALVKDDSSFGMMRMFGTYADMHGFRSEDDFYVTTDMLDGVTWLLGKTEESEESAETIAAHFAGL